MGATEDEAFLSHLAVEGKVSASTQNQALSALLFLYKEVLLIDLPWLDNVVRAKRPQRLPCVLTRTEVRSVLTRMSGNYGLMANLLYGIGMRLMECVRLRVKDVDFERGEILIRDGKGAKGRVTMLPESLKDSLLASNTTYCTKKLSPTADTNDNQPLQPLYFSIAASFQAVPQVSVHFPLQYRFLHVCSTSLFLPATDRSE